MIYQIILILKLKQYKKLEVNKMESIYAALLLHKASKKITEANIEKILKAVDVDVDKTQITKLIAGLKGKKIDEIIASAAAGPVIAAPVAATGAAPAKAEAPAKKKDEEEEEEEEEPTGSLSSVSRLVRIGSLF